jgi:hypothetical protein
MMKEKVKQKLKNAAEFVAENPTEILMLVGIVGIVGMAIRGNKKNLEYINQHDDNDEYMQAWLEHCNSFEYQPNQIIETTATEGAA